MPHGRDNTKYSRKRHPYITSLFLVRFTLFTVDTSPFKKNEVQKITPYCFIGYFCRPKTK